MFTKGGNSNNVPCEIQLLGDAIERDLSSAGTLESYTAQEDLYRACNTGIDCKETQKRVRDLVGSIIYRNVKFLSEEGKTFEEPDFVREITRNDEGKEVTKIQSIKICLQLMNQIGKFLLV